MTPHTTSLEVAKQLTAVCREKGIEMPESDYYWANADTCGGTAGYSEHHSEFFVYPKGELPTDNDFKKYGGTKLQAWTLGELMRMLPDLMIVSRKEEIWTAEVLHTRCWFDDGGDYFKNSPYGDANTPEDAAALLFIELIKSGEITSLHVSA